MKKNKGEPLGPPSFLFEPWRGARVGSHRCPILRARHFKYTIHDPMTEKTDTTFVTVLIRRLRRANPCGSLPARCVPLTWSLGQACSRLWSGEESRRTIEEILSVSGESRPSADVMTVRGRPRRDGLRHGRNRKERPKRPRKRSRNDRRWLDDQVSLPAGPEKKLPILCPRGSPRSGCR